MQSLSFCLVAFLFVQQVCVFDASYAQILEEIDLNPEEINFLVDRHNEFRRLRNSSDMRLISWDDAIAASASFRTTEFEYPFLRPPPMSQILINGFEELGENYYSVLTVSPQGNRTKILDSVAKWYDEVEYYYYEDGFCEQGKVCESYTQVVWADSYKIGCAAAIHAYPETDVDVILVVCNYGPAGNVGSQAPYQIGEPCSQCKDESDVCVTGLCANENRENVIAVQPGETSTPPETLSTSTKAPEEQIDLTEEEIDAFVNMHNSFRRQQNSSNMRLMSWDQNIANIAKRHSRQCEVAYSSSQLRFTEKFQALGENIYSTPSPQRNRTTILDSVGKWYDEGKYWISDLLFCEEGKSCNNYIQLAWSDSYKFGCGATFCLDPQPDVDHRILVVCNYGPASESVGSQAPYQIGEPCSQCKDESDVCVTGLCANSNRGDVIPSQLSTTSQPEETSMSYTLFSTSSPTHEEPTTFLNAATTSHKVAPTSPDTSPDTSHDTAQTTVRSHATSAAVTPRTVITEETTDSIFTTPTSLPPSTTPRPPLPSTTGRPSPTTECGGEDLKQWRETFKKWKCQHEQYIAQYLAAEDGNDTC